MHFIFSSCPLRNLQITLPSPNSSVMTGCPTHSFGLGSITTRSRAYTFIISSPVHRAFNVSVTLQLSQYWSQSQSRVYSTSSICLLLSGMRPSRWAMNSSASTEVLVSTSTRSIAIVGTSARMVRRREFAKARSTLPSVKSTRSFAACARKDVRPLIYAKATHTSQGEGLVAERRCTNFSDGNSRANVLQAVHSVIIHLDHSRSLCADKTTQVSRLKRVLRLMICKGEGRKPFLIKDRIHH